MNKEMPTTYKINDQKNLQEETAIQPAYYGFIFMGGLVIGGILIKYFWQKE